MSRIYFHSESKTVEILGAERAWCGWVSTNFALGALGLTSKAFSDAKDAQALARAMTPPPHGTTSELLALSLGVRADEHTFTLPDGTRHGAWHVMLNTCIDGGSDPIRLLARIHAQCEIHAWADGPDRAWLAGVIEAGRGLGIMRAGMGWEALCVMLRARADEPVVMSYSVCRQFPNDNVAGWAGTEEEWYALPRGERWELAMMALREKNMQITPDNLGTYGFGTGLNAWQLLAALRASK